MLTPYIILSQLANSRSGIQNSTSSNSVILELWEIDTFEGGSASRAHFLENTASRYQDKNSGVFILVKTLGLEQAELMLSQGASPDIISYGIGAGELILPLCREMNNADIRQDLLGAGISENKQYAVPWCFGSYVLCTKDDYQDFSIENLESANAQIIGMGQDNNIPKLSLDANLQNKIIKNDITPYKAYESFLDGDFDILLGTQRDFYRLNNRVNNGKLSGVQYIYLNQYTDLVQYLSITTKNDNLVAPAQNFIDFVVNQDTQKRLKDIGMFSVLNTSIYTNEYRDFENALSSNLDILNVFTSNARIKELQGL